MSESTPGSKKKRAPKTKRTTQKKAAAVAESAGNDNQERTPKPRRFKNPNFAKLRAALAQASEDPSLLHGVPELPGDEGQSA